MQKTTTVDPKTNIGDLKYKVKNSLCLKLNVNNKWRDVLAKITECEPKKYGLK